jgi:hypothetical protein
VRSKIRKGAAIQQRIERVRWRTRKEIEDRGAALFILLCRESKGGFSDQTVRGVRGYVMIMAEGSGLLT